MVTPDMAPGHFAAGHTSQVPSAVADEMGTMLVDRLRRQDRNTNKKKLVGDDLRKAYTKTLTDIYRKLFQKVKMVADKL